MTKSPNKRIWELDALRGICILGMVIVHLLFDLAHVYMLIDLSESVLFDFLTMWGGVLFLLISGICITLGHHPIRRGLIVLGGAAVISLATWGMYITGYADKDIIIYFGVLHCLGVCMLLWPLMKKFPTWLFPILGGIIIAYGLYVNDHVIAKTPWLIWLGFSYSGFETSDYFPLLPNLGYFMVGIFLGKTLYKKKVSLLPKVNDGFFLIRFFSFCGKQSLWIYLLHQPLLTGIIELYLLLR